MSVTEKTMNYQPRRSCLYMPGSNARALEKAKNLNVDVVILDLEDSVAPDAKLEARTMVCDAVAAGGFGEREVVIRVNGHDTEWGRDDMRAAIAAKPDAVLAPKVNSATDVTTLRAIMKDGTETELPFLWAMIETPIAILNVREIASIANEAQLSAFVMGTNDLAKEMRVSPTVDRMAFQFALSASVMAARAFDITVIDGVFNDIKDETGFAAECAQGNAMGFDGKTLIHPAQINACNSVFSPTPEAVDRARAIITAFDDPANKGKGVIKVDGKMTELLHLEDARRLLALADAIELRAAAG